MLNQHFIVTGLSKSTMINHLNICKQSKSLWQENAMGRVLPAYPQIDRNTFATEILSGGTGVR
jgi:hypothetical protein